MLYLINPWNLQLQELVKTKGEKWVFYESEPNYGVFYDTIYSFISYSWKDGNE